MLQRGAVRHFATGIARADKPTSLLSRLSDRTRSSPNSGNDAEPKTSEPRPRATSFVSARSAQRRDDAAEKWFTDVRKLDIGSVDQPDDPNSLPRKQRRSRPHEMRPRTDLNALFAPTTIRDATSLRVQTKKELGGDYASYLPHGNADPIQHPVEYARLALGRNKQIPLSAQTGALDIIEEAIRGKTSNQARAL